MKIQTHSLKHRAALGTLSALTLAAAGLLTTGCGIHSSDLVATPVTSQGVAFQGNIHGGQQPVAGASLQLYAASNAGYGAASYALFTIPVTSDANGNFNFTGDYTCPANAQVYLVATGGNPGAGANANLALMSALGPCSNLTPATFITVNEITTVASAYALSPFMTEAGKRRYQRHQRTRSHQRLRRAVNKLANITNGGSSGTLPTGATAPVTEINTLADILAACINTTGGNAGTTTTNCGKLFSYATPAGGPAPTDTITAILNIAKKPRQQRQLAAQPRQPAVTLPAHHDHSQRLHRVHQVQAVGQHTLRRRHRCQRQRLDHQRRKQHSHRPGQFRNPAGRVSLHHRVAQRTLRSGHRRFRQRLRYQQRFKQAVCLHPGRCRHPHPRRGPQRTQRHRHRWTGHALDHQLHRQLGRGSHLQRHHSGQL